MKMRLFRDSVVAAHLGKQTAVYGDIEVIFVTLPMATEQGCIEWPYGTSHHGYGIMADGSGTDVVTRQVLAITEGPPPVFDGFRTLACHHCDNPPCINPKHLYWGSELDNAQDTVVRNRHPVRRGVDNPHAKLTEDDVHAIDAMLADGHSQEAVAQVFRVGQTAIAAIRSRRTWSHVEPRVTLPAARARRRAGPR